MTGFAHELTGRPWPGYDDSRPRCRCGPFDPFDPYYVCDVCEDARDWADFCALAEAHLGDGPTLDDLVEAALPLDVETVSEGEKV